MSDYRFFALLLALLIGSIPLYRFARILLRQRMSQRVATWVASTLTTFLLLGAALSGSVWLYLHYPRQTFDTTYWAASESERYTMRDDLIQSRRLIGLSELQVRQILGKPSTHYIPEETMLFYDIGYPPSLTIRVRPELLVIQFQDGRVIGVK